MRNLLVSRGKHLKNLEMDENSVDTVLIHFAIINKIPLIIYFGEIASKCIQGIKCV